MQQNKPSPQDFTATGVRKQMQLPAGMEAAYDKIIKAGLRIMFDPSTRDETMDFMDDADGNPEKMAEGVSSVVALLFKESNETIPPNLIIPAGIELLVHAADVARKGGIDISNEQLADGMGQLVHQVLMKFGATPDQMQKLMSSMDSGQAAPSTNNSAPAPRAAAQGV